MVGKIFIKRGSEDQESSWVRYHHARIWALIIILFVLVLLIGFTFFDFDSRFTGSAIDVGKEVYYLGERIDGSLEVILLEGELIPADTLLVVTLGEVRKEYNLRDYVNFDTIEGSFYAEGSDLIGSGEGFGVEGVVKDCPYIDFEFEVVRESSSGDSGGSSSDDVEEVVDEVIEGDVLGDSSEEGEGSGEIDDVAEESLGDSDTFEEDVSSVAGDSVGNEGDSGSEEASESEESSGDSSEGSGATITGSVVADGNFISASVSYGDPYSYSLGEGETIEIRGVFIDGDDVSESLLDLDFSEGEVIVSTDYCFEESGFGEDYLGAEAGIVLNFDVSDFELEAVDDELKIELVYGESVIASYNEQIDVVGEGMLAPEILEDSQVVLLNEIPLQRIPFEGDLVLDMNNYFEGAMDYGVVVDDIQWSFEENLLTFISPSGFSGARKAVILGIDEFGSLESNEFTILVSSGAVKLKKTRNVIKLNENVVWTQTIEKSRVEEEFSVEIPEVAENLIIEEFDEEGVKIDEEVYAIPEESASGGSILTGDVIIDVDLERNAGTVIGWRIRKKLISPLKEFLANYFRFLRITGNVIGEMPRSGSIDIVLDDVRAVTTVIEYETPAPISEERIIAGGKEVKIIAPDLEGHVYEDVLAHTELDNVLSLDNVGLMKLYWVREQGDVVDEGEIISPGEIVEDEVVVEEISVDEFGEVVGDVEGDSSGSSEDSGNYVREEMPFDAYDLDLDGMIDYVEWVVPHLSNQTFEIIISSAPSTPNITEETNFSYLSVDTSSAPYNDILSYYNFDGDSGAKSYDFTRNNLDGTNYGGAGVGSTGCIYGECLQLDGINDYVLLSGSTVRPELDDFSISLWIKTSGDGTIIGACDERDICDGVTGTYALSVNPSGKIFYFVSEWGSVTSSASVDDSEWHYITLTFDESSSNVSIYIDGGIDNSGITYDDDSTTSWQPYLGVKAELNAKSDYFNGSIDEVMFFNTTLSSAQISAIYGNTSNRFKSSGEMLFENFGDISGDEFIDLSIEDCETLFSTSIEGKINDGSYQTFSNCRYDNYSLSGISGLESANLTLRLNSNANNFYTPIVYTNISLISFLDTAPLISFNENTPADDSSFEGNSIFVDLDSGDDVSDHYSFVDFDNDLVLWMTMDEIDGSGNPYDNSSYGNHGTKQADAAQTSSGYWGSGFSFDGTGDYITLPYDNSLNITSSNNWTVSMWINPVGWPSVANQAVGLLTSTTTRDGFLLWASGTAFMYFGETVGNGYDSSYDLDDIPLNQWTHLVIDYSFDGTNARFNIYQNGAIDIANWVTDEGKILVLGELHLGKDSGSDDRVFNGTIDDVLIFNRSLSSTEVEALYNSTSSQYSNNFTNLADGAHTFIGRAVDRTGNKNSTEERTVTTGADLIYPSVEFVGDTPANGSSQDNTDIFVNLSSSDNKGDHYSFVDFDNDLVLWMTMDEIDGSGNPYDNSSYGNHGTKQADAAQTSSGYWGSGFSFDGTGDYISFPEIHYEEDDNWTISFWTYSVQERNCMPLGKVAQAWNYIALYYASDTIYFRNSSGTQDNLAIGADLDINRWNMISVKSNSSSGVEVYLDGIYKGSIAVSPDWYIDAIGDGYTTSSWDFNGTIDDVFIFNRSLSDSEIKSLYNSTASQYSNNFTDLTYDNHAFTGYAMDKAGNRNSTETRTVTIADLVYPSVEFVGDTPSDGSAQSEANIFVNLSSSDDLGDHYSFVDFDNDLLLWMRMDDVDGSGNPYDLSSYSNNGTKQADAAQTSSGYWGSGFSFDGVGDHIQITDSSKMKFVNGENYTWSFWIYPTGTSGFDGVMENVDQESGFHVVLNTSTGQLGFTNTDYAVCPSSDCILGSAVSLNTWTLVTYTYSNGSVSGYLNGQLDFTNSSLSFNDAPGDVNLGASAYSGTNVYFEGRLDEFLFFNRTLDSSEISSLYNSTASQYSNNFTGLVLGDHSFIGHAVDKAGNKNSTATRTVTIAGAPSIAFTTATENSGALVDATNIYAGVTVSVTGTEDTIVFNLYGADGGPVNSTSYTNGARSINWIGLSAGNYSYEVIVNQTNGLSAGTGNSTIILLPSCLSLGGCAEDDVCVISENCYLHNGLCSGGVCNFISLTLNDGVKIYTLYNNVDGRNLTLNLTDTTNRTSLTSGSGSGFVFSGKRGSDRGSGSAGGDAGILNVTVYDLLNTTNLNLTGVGGYSTASFTQGGDGGDVYLYYHGLIRKFDSGTAGVDLSAGSSFSDLLGVHGGNGDDSECVDGVGAGCPYYNRDLMRYPLDVDVNDDGVVNSIDYTLIEIFYNKLSSDLEYSRVSDINGDLRLSVQDIAKVGFEYRRGIY